MIMGAGAAVGHQASRALSACAPRPLVSEVVFPRGLEKKLLCH